MNFQLPNLIEIQLDSYKWFLEKGLRELFDEISPIREWGGKDLEVYFLDYYIDEPKHDDFYAKAHNLSYEASLRCRVKLVNKKTNREIIHEVYLGEVPLMTKRGTFVVNGVERAVVSQLIRSPGVFFTAVASKGKNLFGAKVIPNRGSWMEFDTDQDGAIGVRIDRRRRIPVTALLRAFGLEKDEDIKRTFKDVDNGEISYIEATLSKDRSKNRIEGYVEVYRKIRPGDLAAADNARSFIQAMFSFERYDLGEVGRWKMNQRLNLRISSSKKGGTGRGEEEFSKEDRVIKLQDLIAIVKEIIRLNNTPFARPDDIDHLGNRRVRSVGELLQNKLRTGIIRMARIARDRMSTLDVHTMTPSQLINARPFMASIREFFTSSQLSQFMDQVNPLSELEHKRRLSAMGPGGLTRERAGFEVRDVHPTYYGRICPIETPEGPNIGLVGHLATYARLNRYGFIETPYFKVKNGRVTNEVVYLNAWEEQRYNIAHAGVRIDKKGYFIDKQVSARIKGQPGMISRNKVDFIDVAPCQCISVATSLIPFLEHDDANRALMGSNMQRQAIPCIKPQAPLVATGMEKKAAEDSGQIIIAEEDGEVIEVDANHIKVRCRELDVRGKNSNNIKTYQLHNFVSTNQYTCISFRPLVRKGNKVRKGQVLADGPGTDKGQLALGQNLLVAFMSYRGGNYEDAIIISEKLVKEDRFTSIHIESFTCDVRETKLGPEITTCDIPNVGEERLKDLDEEGIVRIGAEVGPNDILVGKISPKGEADLTPEERLLRAIFGEKARDVKDTSLRLPHGKRGRVIGIHIFTREKGDRLQPGVIKSIQIDVAQIRKVSVGDKLAGRHGNKGVIAQILPEEDMPYLENGTPVDIVLNPLGVASRMNIGQILETHLGWVAEILGCQMISPALAGVSAEEIKRQMINANLPPSGKVRLFDGKTGESFHQPITVGYIYMMKLNHMVEDKIHMRAVGPYSLITQQPLGGKAQFGGQRFGEMEVWALEGYGAAHTLQEMLTIKSDDVVGRTNTYDAILRGKPVQEPNVPSAFSVLVNELKGLGLDVEVVE